MTTKVNVMVSLEVNRRGEGVGKVKMTTKVNVMVSLEGGGNRRGEGGRGGGR